MEKAEGAALDIGHRIRKIANKTHGLRPPDKAGRAGHVPSRYNMIF